VIASAIESLAANIDRQWRAFEFDERRFANLAQDCLAQAQLHAELDGTTLLHFACSPRPEARARYAAPGVLPLYDGHRFEIHAHFWPDDVAVAHDHGWAGAFHIIEGRSLNSYHRFVEHEYVRSSMRIGRLERTRIELHTVGDSIVVRPGSDFIHALHYLDRAGAAISVRSKLRQHQSMTYLRPGLALGELATDAATEHALRALAIAWRRGEASYLELLERLVRAGDRVSTFVALSRATQEGWPLPPAISAAGRERHGQGFDVMLPALEDLRAYQEVVDLRVDNPDPELRAFLAALHLSEDRAQLVEALAASSSTLARHADVWARVGACLVALLVDAEEAEVPAALAPALGQIARGCTIDALREQRSATQAPSLDEPQLEFLASAQAAMRERPLYRALFREPAA
jgi:hypothetical protein